MAKVVNLDIDVEQVRAHQAMRYHDIPYPWAPPLLDRATNTVDLEYHRYEFDGDVGPHPTQIYAGRVKGGQLDSILSAPPELWIKTPDTPAEGVKVTGYSSPVSENTFTGDVVFSGASLDVGGLYDPGATPSKKAGIDIRWQIRLSYDGFCWVDMCMIPRDMSAHSTDDRDRYRLIGTTGVSVKSATAASGPISDWEYPLIQRMWLKWTIPESKSRLVRWPGYEDPTTLQVLKHPVLTKIAGTVPTWTSLAGAAVAKWDVCLHGDSYWYAKRAQVSRTALPGIVSGTMTDPRADNIANKDWQWFGFNMGATPSIGASRTSPVTINTSTNRITWTNHGLQVNSRVRFVVPTSTLPTATNATIIIEGYGWTATDYRVATVHDVNTISLTPEVSADDTVIDFSGAGANVVMRTVAGPGWNFVANDGVVTKTSWNQATGAYFYHSSATDAPADENGTGVPVVTAPAPGPSSSILLVAHNSNVYRCYQSKVVSNALVWQEIIGGHPTSTDALKLPDFLLSKTFGPTPTDYAYCFSTINSQAGNSVRTGLTADALEVNPAAPDALRAIHMYFDSGAKLAFPRWLNPYTGLRQDVINLGGGGTTFKGADHYVWLGGKYGRDTLESPGLAWCRETDANCMTYTQEAAADWRDKASVSHDKTTSNQYTRNCHITKQSGTTTVIIDMFGSSAIGVTDFDTAHPEANNTHTRLTEPMMYGWAWQGTPVRDKEAFPRWRDVRVHGGPVSGYPGSADLLIKNLTGTTKKVNRTRAFLQNGQFWTNLGAITHSAAWLNQMLNGPEFNQSGTGQQDWLAKDYTVFGKAVGQRVYAARDQGGDSLWNFKYNLAMQAINKDTNGNAVLTPTEWTRSNDAATNRKLFRHYPEPSYMWPPNRAQNRNNIGSAVYAGGADGAGGTITCEYTASNPDWVRFIVDEIWHAITIGGIHGIKNCYFDNAMPTMDMHPRWRGKYSMNQAVNPVANYRTYNAWPYHVITTEAADPTLTEKRYIDFFPTDGWGKVVGTINIRDHRALLKTIYRMHLAAGAEMYLHDGGATAAYNSHCHYFVPGERAVYQTSRGKVLSAPSLALLPAATDSPYDPDSGVYGTHYMDSLAPMGIPAVYLHQFWRTNSYGGTSYEREPTFINVVQDLYTALLGADAQGWGLDVGATINNAGPTGFADALNDFWTAIGTQ